jgi:hypothetical protein
MMRQSVVIEACEEVNFRFAQNLTSRSLCPTAAIFERNRCRVERKEDSLAARRDLASTNDSSGFCCGKSSALSSRSRRTTQPGIRGDYSRLTNLRSG